MRIVAKLLDLLVSVASTGNRGCNRLFYRRVVHPGSAASSDVHQKNPVLHRRYHLPVSVLVGSDNLNWQLRFWRNLMSLDSQWLQLIFDSGIRVSNRQGYPVRTRSRGGTGPVPHVEHLKTARCWRHHIPSTWARCTARPVFGRPVSSRERTLGVQFRVRVTWTVSTT